MSIKLFQKTNDLKPDGIVGVKTLLKFKELYELSNESTAHFFGQIAHETGMFKYNTENLNYSYKGLLKVFSKYFPTEELARKYERQPQKIANKVYANRMGNGSERSGDGWKYRGRGALQTTGYNNYKEFSDYKSNLNILQNTDLVATVYYLESALFYFNKHNIFDLTNEVNYNSVKKVTKKINGGYNGLIHRFDLTRKYYKLLKDYEKNKPKNTQSSNSSTDSDNSVPKNNKSLPEKETKKDTVRTEKRKNKTGFFSRIIRWFLQKINGRHVDKKGVKTVN